MQYLDGVNYARLKRRRRKVRRLLIFDVDRTLVYEKSHHQLEAAEDQRLAKLWNLPTNVFDLVRAGDVRERQLWFDIFYTPLVCQLVLKDKLDVSPATMLEMQKQWLESVAKREGKVQAFPGTAETLARIRQEWARRDDGDLEIWAHTDAPVALLAGHRLAAAGLAKHFDGIIGIAPNFPLELLTYPYVEAVHMVQAHIEALYKKVPRNVRFIAELGQHQAKPTPTGPLAALATCNLAEQVSIVDVDDRWSKGGKVAAALRQSFPDTSFILADIEDSEPTTQDTPPIFGTAKQFSDVGQLVNLAFARTAKAA